MPKEENKKSDLGEKLWDSTKEFLVRVKEDADKSIKIISLKNEVSRLKRERNGLYTRLGETAYQRISLGSLEDNELKPMADEIEKLQQEIEDKERQIEKIKTAIAAPAPEKPPIIKKAAKAPRAKRVKKATKKAKRKTIKSEPA